MIILATNENQADSCEKEKTRRLKAAIGGTVERFYGDRAVFLAVTRNREEHVFAVAAGHDCSEPDKRKVAASAMLDRLASRALTTENESHPILLRRTPRRTV